MKGPCITLMSRRREPPGGRSEHSRGHRGARAARGSRAIRVVAAVRRAAGSARWRDVRPWHEAPTPKEWPVSRETCSGRARPCEPRVVRFKRPWLGCGAEKRWPVGPTVRVSRETDSPAARESILAGDPGADCQRADDHPGGLSQVAFHVKPLRRGGGPLRPSNAFDEVRPMSGPG